MHRSRVEVLRAACCIAGLDDQVCGKERKLLDRVADRIGVGSASLDAMISRAESDKSFYEEQFDIVTAEADETVKTLVQIAMVDGQITVDERAVLAHFAEVLGMSHERFGRIMEAADRRLGRSSST